jgi:C1A family cysteine protease
MDQGDLAVKGKTAICIVLLFCVIASASLLIINSIASEDKLSKYQYKSDRFSSILKDSEERAKSVADRINIVKQKAELRHSKQPISSLNASENAERNGVIKSYPTGLIVTASELAENRVKIREANRLMSASGINVSYPVSWDWRSKGGVTAVKDQRTCGACVAFAAVATEESAWLINNSSHKYDLSEWYLFQKGGGDCSAGSRYEWILKAANAPGTVTEECCPYLESTVCTSPLYKISSWKKIYNAAQAKEYISKKGPLMTGMEVYEDFYWVDSNEIYMQEFGSFMAYHAICIVGYDDTAGCWIVKNSWSRGWGDDGYCRIAYNQCGIGVVFPFYSVEIAPASDPVPLPKAFSAKVISRPSGIFDFGITVPNDKWVLKTTKYGAAGEIGTYPSNQRFGYKIKTSDGLTYYSDQSKNPDGLKHATILNLTSGNAWISWKGITGKYTSDVVIQVTSK